MTQFKKNECLSSFLFRVLVGQVLVLVLVLVGPVLVLVLVTLILVLVLVLVGPVLVNITDKKCPPVYTAFSRESLIDLICRSLSSLSPTAVYMLYMYEFGHVCPTAYKIPYDNTKLANSVWGLAFSLGGLKPASPCLSTSLYGGVNVKPLFQCSIADVHQNMFIGRFN